MLEVNFLSMNNINDFFDLFDNHLKRFSQNNVCYCVSWNISREEFYKEIEIPVKIEHKSLRDANRRVAETLILQGILQGYIAYIDGVPVGWCNANDKKNYKQFGISKDCTESVFGKTKSIMCFEIAENYKNRGIASALWDLPTLMR